MSSRNEWDEVVLLLDEELMREPASANLWDAQWTQHRNLLLLYDDFKKAEQPFVAEVDAAIESWCLSEFTEWPAVSLAARPLIRLRIGTAHHFVSMLCLGKEDNYASIIPFPDLPPRGIVRWLLIDWWKVNGRELACDLWALEKWDSSAD